MPLNSLLTQSTYCMILCLPCATLKSFLRRNKTFAQRKLSVILKIIPSAIYIRNLVEFCIMAHGEKKKFSSPTFFWNGREHIAFPHC